MLPIDATGMTNIADPDLIAPAGTVLAFNARANMPKNLKKIRILSFHRAEKCQRCRLTGVKSRLFLQDWSVCVSTFFT